MKNSNFGLNDISEPPAPINYEIKPLSDFQNDENLDKDAEIHNDKLTEEQFQMELENKLLLLF